MVAALYVDPTGIYSQFEGVDLWGIDRDARQYAGPFPVVAHPPCARWGRYWPGQPGRPQFKLGDDGGCFAAALAAVREYGGVLEHPADTHAWRVHELARPHKTGLWSPAFDEDGGFVCHVEQGHYGHRARKGTWLYACGIDLAALPVLTWGPSFGKVRLEAGFHSAAERAEKREQGSVEFLSHKGRAATPREFAEVLLSIAANCHGREF